ncbi:hypothetical protein DL95DRAFT_384071 [Leptodontidium sp. 2 PMI_412]|nr:hypothetical protein DL95DRAFT_384071 [Leptodontidium sp. 2 PMI_412]
MSLSRILITSSGTTTTYLPLSTAYPAQAGCSSLFVNPAVEGGDRLFAFDPGYAAHNSGPACMPPQATLWWGQDTATDLTTRTELGGYKMVCPEAYKTVAMSVLDKSSTRVGCCPSGYNFVDWATAPNPLQCNSPLPAAMVTYIQAVPSGTWTTTSTSIAEPSSIWGVQVNGILFAKPVATSTNVITSNAAPSSTEASEPTSHQSGLGRGAKIGIGIGSAMAFVFLCAMLLVGVLFWKRKRTAMTASPSQVAIGPQYSEEDQKSFHNVRTEERHDKQQVDSTRHVGMG